MRVASLRQWLASRGVMAAPFVYVLVVLALIAFAWLTCGQAAGR